MIYILLEIAVFDVPEKTFLETRDIGTARYTLDLLKGDNDIWRINTYKISYFQQVVQTSAVCAGTRKPRTTIEIPTMDSDESIWMLKRY